MLILEADPDRPLVEIISTPAAFPFRILVISPVARCSISSLLNSVTAYPNAFFSFRIPNAVITTSSNSDSSICILIFILLVAAVTVFDWVR